MATYIANSASREVVTLMFSKAEADALRDLAVRAYEGSDEPLRMNSSTKAAACRAMDALAASTDTRARRAGFFET